MQEPVKLKIWNKRNRVKLCKYDKSAFRVLFEELSVQLQCTGECNGNADFIREISWNYTTKYSLLKKILRTYLRT